MPPAALPHTICEAASERASSRCSAQSLGYALWDACSVLAARGLVVAGASLGRLRLLRA